VFQVDKEAGELELTEIADGVTVQEIISATGCNFRVAEDLKPMAQVDLDE
jgi:3-oxoacid CoA-transferase